MTINAEPRTVNRKGRPQDDPKSPHVVAEATLSRVVGILQKTKPDQFANVLEREWRNELENLVAHGYILPEWLGVRLLDGANGRANCNGAVDYFLAQLFPAQKTLDDIKANLGFSDGAYRPGDEPEELIKRLLPKEGVTMIGGQSGAGKTFFLLSMALALATGEPFMGMPTRERVGVIIVAAEGAGTISSRLEAARRHAGITGAIPISVLKRPPVLDTPQAIADLTADLKRLMLEMTVKHGVRVGMVAIDTVSSAFALVNENDNSEVANVCRCLANMAHELRVALVPVHHFGKDQAQGLRGASAWRANVDHAISIMAEREPGTDKVTMRSVNLMKSRIGEEGEFCAMTLVPIRLGENRYGEEIYSCAVEPSEKPKPQPKKRKGSVGEKKFAEAYEFVCDPSVRRSVGGNGPSVPAVRLEQVKAEFARRYVSDSDTEKNRKDATNLAWKRALEAAQQIGAYATENHRDVAWIWDIDAARML